jgi:hypothetical protein
MVRSNFARLLAPTLCLGMLMGAMYAEREWPQRADAKPYHDRCALAIGAIPLQMGPWVGKERAPQSAAIEVLKPNAIRNIEFTDPRVAALRLPENRISLSIVQVRRIGDMLGHFPPNCYPAFGDTTRSQLAREWVVESDDTGDQPMTIQGMEYVFERAVNGKTYKRIVYNFMVAPKRGILRDMKALEKAAEDYERRYYGAAQVQLVFDSLAGQEMSAGERDQVFSTLMRYCAPAIDVLKSGQASEAGNASAAAE